jgi:gas vesicle protein
MSRLIAFMGGMICGALTGMAFGLLSAPKAGDEMRKDLLEVSENVYRKAAYELEEIAEHIEDVRHKADVIDATKEIKADSALAQAQDAVRDASQTAMESQKVLRQTSTPTASQG